MLNIVITGGTSGIGNFLAKSLAQFHKVIVLYKSNDDEASKLISEYGITGVYNVDIGNYEDVKWVIDLTEAHHGHIDLLINNAGILMNKKFEEMEFEEWNRIVQTNLIGTMNVTNACIPSLKGKGGNIVNIASISGGERAYKGQTVYGATKAGIVGFSKALAKELGMYNIRVNVINPGFIETPMLNEISEEYQKRVLKEIPIRRFGDSENVLSVIKMIVDNDYINGSVITLDGGLSG